MPDIYTLNAFSDSANGGNPAGVVPSADRLNDDEMQSIAKKLGYSETAFVQSSSLADFKVRFFTPVAEVDLCGHATIATFALLFHLKKIGAEKYFQETKAGVFDVDVTESGEVFMTQAEPAFSEELDRNLIAKSLKISVDDLHPDYQPQVVSTGLKDIIVPVKNMNVMNGIRPDFMAVSAVSKEMDAIGYHLFSLDTLHDSTAHCRNFAPLFGIDEEAATGTASGALSAYLYRNKIIDAMQAQELIYEQGYLMNRPSKIKAKLDIYEGDINRVEVGGSAFLLES